MGLLKILRFLEDPKHPCLGPHLRLLGLLSLWKPNMKSVLTRLKLAFVYFTFAYLFSQYVRFIMYFNNDSLQLILKYAPFHMGVVKIYFFQKDCKKWEQLITFVSSEELQQIAKKDKKQKEVMTDYINRTRRVTYFFWALANFANISIFSEPYQQNQINENGTNVYVYIFDGYTPFSREPPGYYYSMIIQTVCGLFMSASIVVWDMLVVSIMIFFAGQLRMSRLYCRRLIDLTSSENSHQNIASCHRFHTTMVLYQRLFNDLISPVMFIYLVVICVNLGVCIIGIAEIKDDVSALLSGCLYIMACLIQLLLFYWHGNDVTIESELVPYSVFKSKWVEADKTVQKEVALLTLTTRTRLVFTAGPFNEVSLPTFILILRSSYSFYTLMKSTN